VYEAAIVATGARPRALTDSLAAAGALSWFDVLDKGAPVPFGARRAVFVDDGTGFWWNYGVAEALVAGGWTLTLVTPSAAVAHLIPHESVAPLLARLGAGQATFEVLTGLERVSPQGAHLVRLISGEDWVLPCELVVVQTGREPVAGPLEALAAADVPLVHSIGDCITPRRMSFAVYEAQRIARTI
jgi:2,4-dienoyl-CoA reductase (NADPH2)